MTLALVLIVIFVALSLAIGAINMSAIQRLQGGIAALTVSISHVADRIRNHPAAQDDENEGTEEQTLNNLADQLDQAVQNLNNVAAAEPANDSEANVAQGSGSSAQVPAAAGPGQDFGAAGGERAPDTLTSEGGGTDSQQADRLAGDQTQSQVAPGATESVTPAETQATPAEGGSSQDSGGASPSGQASTE